MYFWDAPLSWFGLFSPAAWLCSLCLWLRFWSCLWPQETSRFTLQIDNSCLSTCSKETSHPGDMPQACWSRTPQVSPIRNFITWAKVDLFAGPNFIQTFQNVVHNVFEWTSYKNMSWCLVFSVFVNGSFTGKSDTHTVNKPESWVFYADIIAH